MLKGWFTFNEVTSLIYSGAALFKVGPYERDTRGMAESIRVNGSLYAQATAGRSHPHLRHRGESRDPSRTAPKS